MAVVCVQVWRSIETAFWIGKNTNDIQVFVVNCAANNQPVIDNFVLAHGASQRGGDVLDACVGVPLAFSLRVSDPDINDTLTVEVDTSAVPGLTYGGFGTNPQLMFFHWTPTAPGRYFLEIRGRDHYCPLPGIASRTIVIEVGRFCVDAAITYTSCDSANGAIDLTAQGGITPYQFLWNTGDTTEDLTNLRPGYYQVTITDQQGFSTRRSYTLFGPDLLLNPSFIDPTCNDSGAITLNVAGGSPPYRYQWNTGDTTSFLLGTVGNTGYSVQVEDANGCPRNGAWLIPAPDSCFNILEGVAFFDANQNCRRDPGEILLPNMWVRLDSPGVSTLTDSNGYFSFVHYQTGLQRISAIPQGYLRAHCLAPGGDSLRFDSLGMALQYDLAFYADSVNDLVVNSGRSWLRPGFQSNIPLYVKNEGTRTMQGTLRWRYDSLMKYISASPPHARHDSIARIVEWDFVNLNPSNLLHYQALIGLDSTLSIGTIMFDSCWVFPIQGDTIPLNNHRSFFRITTASFDPNDKQALPAPRQAEGWLLPKENTLTYTVRFQNTGNDTAFFVRIQDTLDVSALEVESLKILDASHPYTAAVYRDSFLVVRFDHILLPDSTTDPEGSQGYVTFAIDLKPNLPPHTVIRNRAAIYFDFNKPIITNTVLRTTYKPMTGFRLDTASLCFTEPVNIQVNDGVPPYDFRWPGDSVIAAVQNGRSAMLLDSAGSYQVQVTDAAGQRIVIPFDLTIDSLPDASFDLLYPLPHWVDVVGKDGHRFWHWDFGDGSTGSGQLAYHYYTNGGNYTIKLVAGNACGSDSSSAEVSLTGIAESAFARSVRISPNPMQQRCEIRFANPGKLPVGLKLYDLQGRELRCYAPVRDERFVLERGALPAGMYLFKLESEEGDYVGKLLLE
ncbi:MAG: PKD domain-containing protein [Bacteroidia bacterium]